MKNKLEDLNNHLFAQLERLADEEIIGDELDTEIKRSQAVSKIAKNIIDNASVGLQATKLAVEYGSREVELPQALRLGHKEK